MLRQLATSLALAAALTAATGAEARNLKLGHFGSPGTPFAEGLDYFAEQLKNLSDGQLTVTVFPAGQLGNEAQEIGALQGGLQDFLVTSSTNLTRFNETFQVIDMPFAFPDTEAATTILTGPIGKQILGGLEGSRMVGLSFMHDGFRDLSNSKKPIGTLADFTGLNFRVISAPVYLETFKALGANPVPLPFPEVYSALETGTVDGQDNPLLTDVDQKFYEVQTYLTLSRHAYSALVIVAGQPTWNSLSAQEKEWVQKAADLSAAKELELKTAAYDKGLEYLKTEGGMTVTEFTPEARAEIVKAVAPVTEKLLTDKTRGLYEEMQKAIAE